MATEARYRSDLEVLFGLISRLIAFLVTFLERNLESAARLVFRLFGVFFLLSVAALWFFGVLTVATMLKWSLGTVWFLSIGVRLACGVYAQVYYDYIDTFKADIEKCVAGGQCPVSDSSFHRFREKISWRVMSRTGRIGTVCVFYANVLLLGIISPLLFLPERILGRQIY